MEKRKILRAIGRGRAGQAAMFAGRFALGEIVAEGGAGVVWKAHDRSRGTDVALKFFSPTLCSPAVLEARRHLATALLQCRHPAVVAPDEIVVSGECAAVVMPWVEGRTLGRISRRFRGANSIDEIGAWFAALLGALEEVHTRGLVHGALHPGVIFPQGDEVRVVGWELNAWLRRVTAQARRRPLRLEGKACLSPAVREGQPPTPADDIYALGAILHFLLTGSAPKPRELDDDPVPVVRHRAEIETRGEGRAGLWEQAAQRCMQPRAADRFASVRALRLWLGLEDLSHILSGAAISAPAKRAVRTTRNEEADTSMAAAESDTGPAREAAPPAAECPVSVIPDTRSEDTATVTGSNANGKPPGRAAQDPDPKPEPAHIPVVLESEPSISGAVATAAVAAVNEITETGPADRELVFWPPPEVRRDQQPSAAPLERVPAARLQSAQASCEAKPEAVLAGAVVGMASSAEHPSRAAGAPPAWRREGDRSHEAAPVRHPTRTPEPAPREKIRGVFMLRAMLASVTMLTVAAGGWLVWQIVEQRYPEFADAACVAIRSAGAALMETIERHLPSDRPVRENVSADAALPSSDRAAWSDGFLYGASTRETPAFESNAVVEEDGVRGAMAIRVQQPLFLVPARGATMERGVFDLPHVDAPPRPVSVEGPLVHSDVLARTAPGHVELVLVIDRAGQVISVDAQSATDEALIGPSVDAARHWRFAPATRGGRAVAVRAAVPLAFNTP